MVTGQRGGALETDCDTDHARDAGAAGNYALTVGCGSEPEEGSGQCASDADCAALPGCDQPDLVTCYERFCYTGTYDDRCDGRECGFDLGDGGWCCDGRRDVRCGWEDEDEDGDEDEGTCTTTALYYDGSQDLSSHDASKCREYDCRSHNGDCCGYDYETWCADGYRLVRGTEGKHDCWPGQKGYRCLPSLVASGSWLTSDHFNLFSGYGGDDIVAACLAAAAANDECGECVALHEAWGGAGQCDCARVGAGCEVRDGADYDSVYRIVSGSSGSDDDCDPSGYVAVSGRGCESYIDMDGGYYGGSTYLSGGSTSLEDCAAAVRLYDGQDGCRGAHFFYEHGGYCNCPTDDCELGYENENAGGSGQLYWAGCGGDGGTGTFTITSSNVHWDECYSECAAIGGEFSCIIDESQNGQAYEAFGGSCPDGATECGAWIAVTDEASEGSWVCQSAYTAHKGYCANVHNSDVDDTEYGCNGREDCIDDDLCVAYEAATATSTDMDCCLACVNAECDGDEPHSEICSDCLGEDCDECRNDIGESELAAFVSGGCNFDDGSDIGRWFRDEGCWSLRGCGGQATCTRNPEVVSGTGDGVGSTCFVKTKAGGSTQNYLHWSSGEPNGGTGGNCVNIWGPNGRDQAWNDYRCSESLFPCVRQMGGSSDEENDNDDEDDGGSELVIVRRPRRDWPHIYGHHHRCDRECGPGTMRIRTDNRLRGWDDAPLLHYAKSMLHWDQDLCVERDGP